MLKKPKRKTLPKPSVFKLKNKWVCEYYYFDEKGLAKPTRKSFFKELKNQGKSGSLEEQRTAALAYRDSIIQERKQSERLNQREREQQYLTTAQLKEAKAAFAIFAEIPFRKKSLVDAVMLYRDHLKLAADSPPLKVCATLFLSRKQEAVDSKYANRKLSRYTYRTLKTRINGLVRYFEHEGLGDIKIGDITSAQLIAYFDGLKVGDRTLKNYIGDIGNFFNDAADPKDQNRFLNENPMDGVYVHYRKYNKSKAYRSVRKNARKMPKILQINKVKHVISEAIEFQEHGILGFVVAGLFLSMRPSEVLDLGEQTDLWKTYIKLKEGIVKLDYFGKNRDQRNIVIPDNAKAWLQYLHQNDLPFSFSVAANGQNYQYGKFRARAFLPNSEDAERLIKLRNRRAALISEDDRIFMKESQAILEEYNDVLRHTSGTNYYYQCGFDKNRTVEHMGNSTEIFISHYRGLLTNPEDFKVFWSLCPSDFGL